MNEHIPDIETYTKRLNWYLQEHYPANKKITAEEWNALFLALMNQGNAQEETLEKICNEILPPHVTAINYLLDTESDHSSRIKSLEDSKEFVVNGSYNNVTKSLVLTLKNGNTVDIPVGDLVEGLVNSTDLQNALSTKVDKASGKDLSTNDYTNTDKAKLDGLANIKIIGDNLTLDEQGKLSAETTPSVSSINGQTGAVTGIATTEEVNTAKRDLQSQINTKAPLHEQEGDLIARIDKLTGADQYDLNNFDGRNGVTFMRFSRATNAPSVNFTVATMIVCPYTNGWCQQIFCDLLNNDLYIRNKYDGVWQAWKKIATKSTTTSGTLNWRGSSTGEYIKLGSVTIPKSGTLLMSVSLANYSGKRLGVRASITSGGTACTADFAESVNNDTSINPDLAVSIQGLVTADAVVDIYGKVNTGSTGMVAYYTYTIIN